jgi:hypothetical protein
MWEFLLYSSFVALYLVATLMGNEARGGTAAVFRLTHAFREFVLGQEFRAQDVPNYNRNFYDIVTPEDVWHFLEGPLVNSLFQTKWYNGDEYRKEQGSVLVDSHLLGGVRLRQFRVRPQTCPAFPKLYDSVFPSCYGRATSANEDRGGFGAVLNSHDLILASAYRFAVDGRGQELLGGGRSRAFGGNDAFRSTLPMLIRAPKVPANQTASRGFHWAMEHFDLDHDRRLDDVEAADLLSALGVSRAGAGADRSLHAAVRLLGLQTHSCYPLPSSADEECVRLASKGPRLRGAAGREVMRALDRNGNGYLDLPELEPPLREMADPLVRAGLDGAQQASLPGVPPLAISLSPVSVCAADCTAVCRVPFYPRSRAQRPVCHVACAAGCRCAADFWNAFRSNITAARLEAATARAAAAPSAPMPAPEEATASALLLTADEVAEGKAALRLGGVHASRCAAAIGEVLEAQASPELASPRGQGWQQAAAGRAQSTAASLLLDSAPRTDAGTGAGAGAGDETETRAESAAAQAAAAANVLVANRTAAPSAVSNGTAAAAAAADASGSGSGNNNQTGNQTAAAATPTATPATAAPAAPTSVPTPSPTAAPLTAAQVLQKDPNVVAEAAREKAAAAEAAAALEHCRWAEQAVELNASSNRVSSSGNIFEAQSPPDSVRDTWATPGHECLSHELAWSSQWQNLELPYIGKVHTYDGSGYSVDLPVNGTEAAAVLGRLKVEEIVGNCGLGANHRPAKPGCIRPQARPTYTHRLASEPGWMCTFACSAPGRARARAR